MKKTEKKAKNRITENANQTAEKRNWKETLYNCPYFLLLLVTTIGAMLCSDEIGINLIAAVRAESANAIETGVDADIATATEERVGDDTSEKNRAGNMTEEDRSEIMTGESSTENITENETGQNGEQKQESGLEQSDKPSTEQQRGVTRFEYYEPQHIESVYYSDAGKVAMTTEYDYSIENDSYFNDAAFLGDSRTLGISDYAGLDGADFYCDSGMTIFKLLGEDGVTYQKTGHKVDMKQVLQQKHYGKIYMMLGMNELGYGNTEMYLKQYREVVEQIREWQPDAILYIMANLHVSEAKNNPDTEFNNININDKNAASALLANGKDIFYLDCNPLFTDKDGFLNADLTFDGVHLYAQHYDVWRQFLMEHGVERRETEETERTDDGRNTVE